MEAHITMTGNLGNDVELRQAGEHNTASFRLASTPRLFRDGDWTDGSTTWVTVECWRQLADNVHRSLRKGDPVVVTGRLKYETWTTEEGKRDRLFLEATHVGHDLSRGASMFARNVRPTGSANGTGGGDPQGHETDDPATGSQDEEGAA